jgi:hypothetical protein
MDLPHFKSTDSQFDLFMTFTWQRRLHDWYLKQVGESMDKEVWPVVIDADDVIASPEVVVRYCELIGINPAKLKFEWAPVTDEEKVKTGNPTVQRLLSSLMASSGIQKDKVSTNIDIPAEAVKWEEEFGEKIGGKMKVWVEKGMPDYDFMKARRLRV